MIDIPFRRHEKGKELPVEELFLQAGKN